MTGRRKNTMVNPDQYRDDIVLSDSMLGRLRGRARENIGAQTDRMAGQVKQYGAANRLPPGAVLSGIAGANYEGARGLAGIEPELAGMKRQSVLDYIGMKNQYEAGKEDVDAYNMNLLGDTVGTLGKLAVLYNFGFFDEEQGQGEKWGSLGEMQSHGLGMRVPGV